MWNTCVIHKAGLGEILWYQVPADCCVMRAELWITNTVLMAWWAEARAGKILKCAALHLNRLKISYARWIMQIRGEAQLSFLKGWNVGGIKFRTKFTARGRISLTLFRWKVTEGEMKRRQRVEQMILYACQPCMHEICQTLFKVLFISEADLLIPSEC